MLRDNSFKFINQGAILQEFIVDGQNIVVGYNAESQYRTNPFHFGATIGRVANRIKNAKIDNLNGQSYALPANNGPNSLHGGAEGWGLKDFEGPKLGLRNGRETAVYTYVSPHLDQGYPGVVEVEVAYTGYEKEENGVKKVVLEVEYEAKLVDGAEETPLNITNHSYFNLSNQSTIAGTQVRLPTNLHLAVDATGIPKSIEPTPYPGVTANEPFILGSAEPDIDDCFIINTDPASVPLNTRPLPLKTCAEFYHPDTKLHVEVASTEPAFQFYTGKYINEGPRTDGSPKRVPRAGCAVEPSRYVNAVNVEEWKGMTVVKKGETYGSRIVYTAWRGGKDGL
ncbi:hypothetical protein RUND412_004084 [Rhizina undulata]